MLKVTATNLYGQSLQVTQNSSFRTLVAGLNPPTGSVFTMELATKDGSLFNTGKVNERFITLTVYPQGDVEAARHELYKVFKVSKAEPVHRGRQQKMYDSRLRGGLPGRI